MKTSCLRLAAFAASLLVASLASVQAACESIVWDNWYTGTNNQTGWGAGELYANDPITTYPSASIGTIEALDISSNPGGNIYGTFYYTFMDEVDFTLTPVSFVSGSVKKVCLRVNRTYNPLTNGVDNPLLYINGTTPVAPTSVVKTAGPDGDDFIICWDLCNQKESVTSFFITWSMIEHSTFNKVTLTQCNDCEDDPASEE